MLSKHNLQNHSSSYNNDCQDDSSAETIKFPIPPTSHTDQASTQSEENNACWAFPKTTEVAKVTSYNNDCQDDSSAETIKFPILPTIHTDQAATQSEENNACWALPKTTEVAKVTAIPPTSLLVAEENEIEKKVRKVTTESINFLSQEVSQNDCQNGDTIETTVNSIPQVTCHNEGAIEIEDNKSSLPKTTPLTNIILIPTTSSLSEEETNEIEKNISVATGVTAIEESLLNEESIKNENNDLSWECSACTLINNSLDLTCIVCLYPKTSNDSGNHYAELLALENSEVVLNFAPFECPICFNNIEEGNGITLKNCLHKFCVECLADSIKFSEDPEVKCPFMNDDYSCNSFLQDLEIKCLISKDLYEKHLEKSIKLAEHQSVNAFHCKTANCSGWCINEGEVNEFVCPVCNFQNCLACKAIHTGLTCIEYKDGLTINGAIANRTDSMLQNMVARGEAMNCPKCKVVITKQSGCDWLQCFMCKTEICWVTRNLRWGPAGRGDTSGGCKCKVNGISCHPGCQNCH